MRSYAFAINFATDEAVDEYRKLHEAVWPEVKDSFERIGIKSMQIYYMPPRELLMYIETTDSFVADRDFREYVNIHPKVKEWDTMFCSRFLERIPTNEGVTDWAPMQKIYAYDRRPHRVSF